MTDLNGPPAGPGKGNVETPRSLGSQGSRNTTTSEQLTRTCNSASDDAEPHCMEGAIRMVRIEEEGRE